MKAQNKDSQSKLSPKDALKMLIDGNKRFVDNRKADRNLNEQVQDTSQGQFPFAVVLSCIDSRVPAEIIFDQGIGDIFSARVAGNVVNEDILGSIEYACKVAGSKVVVVLGHKKCGAVTAACQGVELGNITALLSKIKPAVNAVGVGDGEVSPETVEKVAEENVNESMRQILSMSPILAQMEEDGQIEIAGAIYDVTDGQVHFMKQWL